MMLMLVLREVKVMKIGIVRNRVRDNEQGRRDLGVGLPVLHPDSTLLGVGDLRNHTGTFYRMLLRNVRLVTWFWTARHDRASRRLGEL
jgi:hypothetical protein